MKWVYDDGGRAAAGYRGDTGDCVVRAIAIATELPYQQVYDSINTAAKSERVGKRMRGKSNARTGVNKPLTRQFLETLGWKWVPTMFVGQGCKVHLHDGELPMGRLIVQVSRHIVAVIDGVIHDTHDPQRETHAIRQEDGTPLKPGEWRNSNGICSIQRRCVYGYYTKS